MTTQFDLNVRTHTWNHDSRGLFDYESKNVFKKNYRARPTNESYTINRSGSEVGMLMNAHVPASIPSFFQAPSNSDGSLSPLRAPSEVDSRTEAKPLVRVFYESGQYWVDHPDRARDSSKTLWLVIRQAKYPCAVSSGDMLKMGRYKIRVREAATDALPVVKAKRFSVASTDSYDYDSDTCCSPDDDLSGLDNGNNNSAILNNRRASHPLVEVQSVEVCRICYDSGEDGNPLISPCRCAGSMQYVHLKCLRKWMDGRLSVNNDTNHSETGTTTTVSYFWRNLDCELCKLSYPTSVECPSKTSASGVETVDLYELPKPDTPYIVLESNIRVPVPASSSTASTTGITFQKGLHIMSLSKARPSVLVGRGHDADVRINDISVSRLHALIRLVHVNMGNGIKKQQIVIEDRGSKFGSLIAVRGPTPLEPGVPVSIQSGRTITTFTVKKPNLLSTIIPLCFGSNKAAALPTSNSAAVPVLLSESAPSVDLKQVLSSSHVAGQALPEPSGGREQRTLAARTSVASTAMRRASEALSMMQMEEEEDRQQNNQQSGEQQVSQDRFATNSSNQH